MWKNDCNRGGWAHGITVTTAVSDTCQTWKSMKRLNFTNFNNIEKIQMVHLPFCWCSNWAFIERNRNCYQGYQMGGFLCKWDTDVVWNLDMCGLGVFMWDKGDIVSRDACPARPAKKQAALPRPAKSRPCPAPPRPVKLTKPTGRSGAKLTTDSIDGPFSLRP